MQNVMKFSAFSGADDDDDISNISLVDEEAAMKLLCNKMAIPTIVKSNKAYLILVGYTEYDIMKAFQANYTTLNWLLDMVNCKVYMDFGHNRQLLTRSLFMKVSELG